jgi:uncharacterized delta-60 repeat protein
MNLPESPRPIVVIILLLLLLAAVARGEVLVDQRFSPQLGSNAGVNSIQIESGGDVLVGGSFTVAQGAAADYLARFHKNGAADAAFNTAVQPNGLVSTVSLGPDGQILVGGSFSKISGVDYPNLARLLSNGAVDPGLNAIRPPNGSIANIALTPANTILISGSFTYANGSPSFYLGSLTSDGAADKSFASCLSYCASIEAGVQSIAVQPDGKILLGGNFNTARGFEYLIRCNADGSLDTTFAGDHGPIVYPKAIVPLADGRTLVGGTASPDGKGFIRILKSDRSIDSSFPEVTIDGSVRCLEVQSSGQILVGGFFNSIAGQPRQNLARLNTNGTVDNNFDLPLGGVANTIKIDQSSGAIYVGGVFNSVADTATGPLVRLIDSTSPNFHSTSTEGGSFKATLKTEPGRTYVIETSDDLHSWTTFGTSVATDVGLEVLDTTAAGHNHRFFRARLAE